MNRFFIALLISMFTFTFSANAANKNRADLRKSHIAPVAKQKQTDDVVSDRPLSNKNYQIQAREDFQVSPIDSSPPKPTDVNYTPLPSLNDRNPISN